MLQKHVEELANLTAQSKELATKMDAVKALLLDEMKSNKLTSYKSDVGTLSYVTRKSYKYSDAVKAMEQEVKLKKVVEEETGKAQVSVTEYVQIKLPTTTPK